MTKLTPLAFLMALAMATPALADNTPNGVASDVGAVQKDNRSLGNTQSKLAKHRAQKAKDKANNNVSGQAVDSLSIGADKAGQSEKETEKSTDKKILNHDVDDASDK